MRKGEGGDNDEGKGEIMMMGRGSKWEWAVGKGEWGSERGKMRRRGEEGEGGR